MLVEQMLERVRERLAVVDAAASIKDVAGLMAKPHTDLVVVCECDDIVGVVTKTDIIGEISRFLGSGCMARVDSIMTRDVTFCRANEMLSDVWLVMKKGGLQRIPVLDQNRKPIGILYSRDALRYLLTESQIDEELLRDYVMGVGYH